MQPEEAAQLIEQLIDEGHLVPMDEDWPNIWTTSIDVVRIMLHLDDTPKRQVSPNTTT